MFYFVRSYGFGYALKDFVEVIKRRLNTDARKYQ